MILKIKIKNLKNTFLGNTKHTNSESMYQYVKRPPLIQFHHFNFDTTPAQPSQLSAPLSTNFSSGRLMMEMEQRKKTVPGDIRM